MVAPMLMVFTEGRRQRSRLDVMVYATIFPPNKFQMLPTPLCLSSAICVKVLCRCYCYRLFLFSVLLFQVQSEWPLAMIIMGMVVGSAVPLMVMESILVTTFVNASTARCLSENKSLATMWSDGCTNIRIYEQNMRTCVQKNSLGATLLFHYRTSSALSPLYRFSLSNIRVSPTLDPSMMLLAKTTCWKVIAHRLCLCYSMLAEMFCLFCFVFVFIAHFGEECSSRLFSTVFGISINTSTSCW